MKTNRHILVASASSELREATVFGLWLRAIWIGVAVAIAAIVYLFSPDAAAPLYGLVTLAAAVSLVVLGWLQASVVFARIEGDGPDAARSASLAVGSVARVGLRRVVLE